MKTLVQTHDCLLVDVDGTLCRGHVLTGGVLDALTGSPLRALSEELGYSQFRAPLVVGDRLDTDIAAAHVAGLPSLLVLTGDSCASDVVHAGPGQRPTYIARDLSGLHDPAKDIVVAEQSAWRVDVALTAIAITSTGADPGTDGLSVVRAIAHALWYRPFGNTGRMAIRPGDDAAWVALHRWALLPEAESVSGRVRSGSPFTHDRLAHRYP